MIIIKFWYIKYDGNSDKTVTVKYDCENTSERSGHG